MTDIRTPAPSIDSAPVTTGPVSPDAAAAGLPVGDVLVRPEATGYGIFNYRGEPVLEAPVRTSTEAARLAAEIVAPWHGRVRVVDPILGH